MKRSPLLILCLVGTAATLLLAEVLAPYLQRTSAQVGCCAPPAAPAGSAKWAKDSEVTVIIEGGQEGFTGPERGIIETAFVNWNNATSNTTCTKVTFKGFEFGTDPGNSSETYWIQYKDEEGMSTTSMSGSNFARTSLRRPIRRGSPEGTALYLRSTMEHEIGHTLGITDIFDYSEQCSIMCSPGTDQAVITSCDNNKIIELYCPMPTPTPTPTTQQECQASGNYWSYAENSCKSEEDCTNNGGTVNFAEGTCEGGGGGGGGNECPSGTYNWGQLCICSYTPVIIDVLGDGYNLTDVAGGVGFTFEPDGAPRQLAWTAAGSDDAFLVLDRDSNGIIDDGTELFGNLTPQPPSDAPHGFLALAELDKTENGGNSDGVVDGHDLTFNSLRLWRDSNHDGVSQPGELHQLVALHVASISLDYREVRRRDRHGNQFRYQATVTGTNKRITRRLAYDVFLVAGR